MTLHISSIAEVAFASGHETACRCAAAHDELVAALEAMIGLAELVAGRRDLLPNEKDAIGNGWRVQQARAALAKARGESA